MFTHVSKRVVSFLKGQVSDSKISHRTAIKPIMGLFSLTAQVSPYMEGE